MALTDIAIRGAKHGPKPIKLSDEKGLFLLLQPSGASFGGSSTALQVKKGSSASVNTRTSR